jgi:hypothetical protein
VVSEEADTPFGDVAPEPSEVDAVVESEDVALHESDDQDESETEDPKSEDVPSWLTVDGVAVAEAWVAMMPPRPTRAATLALAATRRARDAG